jgi:hypothetical protein
MRRRMHRRQSVGVGAAVQQEPHDLGMAIQRCGEEARGLGRLRKAEFKLSRRVIITELRDYRLAAEKVARKGVG